MSWLLFQAIHNFIRLPILGTLCKGCACQDCLNIPEQEEANRAEQAKIRARNPQAFSLKVSDLDLYYLKVANCSDDV